MCSQRRGQTCLVVPLGKRAAKVCHAGGRGFVPSLPLLHIPPSEDDAREY